QAGPAWLRASNGTIMMARQARINRIVLPLTASGLRGWVADISLPSLWGVRAADRTAAHGPPRGGRNFSVMRQGRTSMNVGAARDTTSISGEYQTTNPTTSLSQAH